MSASEAVGCGTPDPAGCTTAVLLLSGAGAGAAAALEDISSTHSPPTEGDVAGEVKPPTAAASVGTAAAAAVATAGGAASALVNAFTVAGNVGERSAPSEAVVVSPPGSLLVRCGPGPSSRRDSPLDVPLDDPLYSPLSRPLDRPLEGERAGSRRGRREVLWWFV